MEAWKAWHSNDGTGGRRNPLGNLLFGDGNTCGSSGGDSGDGPPAHNNVSSRTRAAKGGAIAPPLPKYAPSLVYTAYLIWNASEDLRAARTIHEAGRAAAKVASTCPI